MEKATAEEPAPARPERELDVVGARRQLRIGRIQIAGRRRRPSGEAPPLPRALNTAGRIWLVAALGMVAIWISLFAAPATTDWWQDRDLSLLNRLVDLRTSSRTRVAEALHALGSEWFVRAIRIALLASLAYVRRWRHFFAVLIAIVLVENVSGIVQEAVGRPRPFVPILGVWDGPSHPSRPVASLVVTLGAVGYAAFPAGTRRRAFLIGTAVVTAVVGIARMYLGIDHPTDVVVALIFGFAVAVVVFRVFAPEAVFPVTWHRGVKAHLDVSGPRGEAIRRAVREQLGIEVLHLEPIGLEGSGGSTPLKLTVATEGTDPDSTLFAKLYSQTHLRSDRWYKLGRSILYGALEDEVRFTTVRRLVEYEDYIQRLMRDGGVPVPAPLGIVEITPEREYLMVSEFLAHATELSETEVAEHIIDQALAAIRRMWDVGLAHRDVKPANVMVVNGQVVLIDVAFGTVRPSPWRQAVDLANMMVILALRSDADTVYGRALLQFAPEDIAEAFAATRSVTLPSESRRSLALLKDKGGVDLVEEFRNLAPPTEPISIQRWSPRRVLRTIIAAIVVALLVGQLLSEISGGGVL